MNLLVQDKPKRHPAQPPQPAGPQPQHIKLSTTRLPTDRLSPLPDPNDQSSRAPHDPFFIQQFRRLEIARPWLQAYLSPLTVQAIDWASLELMPSRSIDGELRSHYPDLLFRVNLQGEPAFIYVLFEHKSSSDPLTAWQILRQSVHIWHDWLNDNSAGPFKGFPVILPLVLYQGDRAWTASRDFLGLVNFPPHLHDELAPRIPNFEYLLVDLHELPMRELQGTVQVRAILALMKAVSEGREIEWIEQVFAPLANVLVQESPLSFIRELMIYLSKSSGHLAASTFRAAISKVEDETAKSQIMTIAEQWAEEARQEGIQKGWQEGRQEGWQEGRQEGRQEGWQLASQQAILRVLERRFGSIPPEIRTRVQSLTTRAELDHALDLALTISTRADFQI